MENKNPFQAHLDNEKALHKEPALNVNEELKTYNLYATSNKSLTVLTQNDEGGLFYTEDIKRLIFLLQEYIK